MPRYRDGMWHAVSAFDAASWQDGVKVTCSCGHFVIYDPHALWWLCEQRGWSDRFGDLQKRLFCSVCRAVKRKKIRPVTIDLTRDKHTVELPMPHAREWKKAMKRVRS